MVPHLVDKDGFNQLTLLGQKGNDERLLSLSHSGKID